MTENIFKGLITALITPFQNNQIDFQSLRKLIEMQITSDVDGLIIGGSTGEGSSINEEEYYTLIKEAVRIVNGRLPIVAGMSSISTDFAVRKARKLSDIGVQGLLSTPPHYIRPTQGGIYEYFKNIHDNSNLPIMLYSHPGRTGVELTDETIIKLAELDRIIALKDSGGDIERPLRLSNKIADFNMLTGDDENTVAYNAHGGIGCVSVASNILPKLCKELQKKCQDRDIRSALRIQQNLLPLYKALFLEGNPIGIKYAAFSLGLCSTYNMRSPLTCALADTKAGIDKVLSIIIKK